MDRLLIQFLNLFAISFILILSLSLLIQKVSLSEPSATLTTQEEADLKQGKVILKGEKGDYLGQVIAPGNTEIAWKVLTDYANFADFLPNIINSKILKEEGNLVIFEQVSLVDLWLLTKQFVVKIAATKTHGEKIDFELVEGDLKSLKGTWEVKKLTPNQVLINHKVTVSPKSQSEEAIFYGIYESSLEDTLKAIAEEIEKRSYVPKQN